jgi:hypothetical protein
MRADGSSWEDSRTNFQSFRKTGRPIDVGASTDRLALNMPRPVFFVSGEGGAGVLKHDVELAREFIGAIRAHR